MEAAPKFSIVTVTYNAASTIEATIRSVLAQTYEEVEYIIVDGASKDDTMNIVARYGDRISKIISEPDKGLYDAMNKGLRLASGDYICFLNAGDRFHRRNTLQQIASSIRKLDNMPGVIYGETELVDIEGHDLGPRRLRTPAKLSWKSFRNGMVVCHQAFFARLDIAHKEPYDLHYRYSADVDWCIRVMKRATALHNTNQIIIDYLNEGMTTRNRWASLKERFAIMRTHYGFTETLLRHVWFVIRTPFK